MNEKKGLRMYEAICNLHDECSECPLDRRNNQFGCRCDEMLKKHPDEFIKIFMDLFWCESDQEAKADKGKPRLSLVPPQIIWDIAEVRGYGVKKYTDPDNWKKVSKERYRDAMFRHMLAYLKDPQGVDEESGLPHLSHMCTNAAFLCELEKQDDSSSNN